MTDKLSHRVLVGGQRQIVTASPGAEKAECEDDCPGTLRRGNGVGSLEFYLQNGPNAPYLLQLGLSPLR